MKVNLQSDGEHQPGPLKGAWGERRLWCAVIAQAINDLSLTASDNRFASRYARDWIGSRDFREVCLLAGVDAEAVKAGIERAIAEGRKLHHTNDETISDRRRAERRGRSRERGGVAA